jgi:hypothetical protein
VLESERIEKIKRREVKDTLAEKIKIREVSPKMEEINKIVCDLDRV